MRVIAGWLGGRTFASPQGHRTHPMSDKIRGAIFSVLGDLNGLTVLDAFAGSGALAIEAISRGAEEAVAIDDDQGAAHGHHRESQRLWVSKTGSKPSELAGAWSTRDQAEMFDYLCRSAYDNIPS